MNNLVSIITPSHNSVKFIRGTIESVLRQTYSFWELIIINDGSVDGSDKIINEFLQNDNRIKVINLDRNHGPAYARNQGIKIAKGKYIAFLDSDDLWHEEKLKIQTEFMEKSKIKFSFTGYQKINEKGKQIGRPISAPEKLTYKDLLKSCIIGCLTVVYDQSEIGKYYMPNYLKTQDYALWLKILKDGIDAYGLDQTLAFYRIRKSSISRNKLIKAYYQWKIYRTQEKLDLVKSVLYMIHYAFHGFKKMF